MRPFSEACERNREPILQVLRERFGNPGSVLEIGAGTGQHAVFMAQQLRHLQWYTTDRQENIAGIREWVDEAALPNLHGPLVLDVRDERWPLDAADYVFSANTAHIMSWAEVELMFQGIGRVLKPLGTFCLYGPFNRAGEFTSESNRQFDRMLRARDPVMGIRDDGDMVVLGQRCGLELDGDYALPANNRILAWVRKSD